MSGVSLIVACVGYSRRVMLSTELYKRAGRDQRAQKQAAANQRLEEAVRALTGRDRMIMNRQAQ